MPEMSADQILAMTPTEAGAHLATMAADFMAATKPASVAAPTNPTEARARLAELAANPKWSADYLNGDLAARREFQTVTSLIAEGSDADLALAGVVPENLVDFGPGASIRDQAAAVPDFRKIGIGDKAIRQLLTDQPISQREHDLAEQWRHQHLKDAEWTKRWLAGDVAAAREMTLCSIVLSSSIDEKLK